MRAIISISRFVWLARSNETVSSDMRSKLQQGGFQPSVGGGGKGKDALYNSGD